MPEIKEIPLSQIRENEVALRSVNHESETFHELVDSVKNKGILNSISVRERTDTETGETYYELIDGLHRFSAAKAAGLDVIPAQVRDFDDADVLDAQIIANVQKVETKPTEYTKQLLRILSLNPLMTETELANRLNKSPEWIKNRLLLSKIKNAKINELIDADDIPLTVAYNLAKLPEEEQIDYVEQAQTDQPDIVCSAINQRLKEIKDSRRKGKDAPEAEFRPTPHLRTLKEIREEINNQAVTEEILSAEGLKSKGAINGFLVGLMWCIHRDKISEEAQKTKFEERKRKKAEDEARKRAERERKKLEKEKQRALEAEKAMKEAEEEYQKMQEVG